MERSHYFYLGGDALHTGIYVDLLRRLADEGLTVNFVGRRRVALNPVTTWRAWADRDRLGPNRIEDLKRTLPGSVDVVPIFSPVPAWSVPSLERVVARTAARGDRVVLHARQYVMVSLALAFARARPRVRVISEVEGDIMAELDYRESREPNPSARTRTRLKLERDHYLREETALTRASDAVVVVTRRLAEVLASRYRLSPADVAKIHVFPSVASKKQFAFDPGKRAATRQALGLGDRFVVVYSGNLGAEWQVPHKLVEVFLLIRRARPDAHFMVMTPERDWPRIRPRLEASGLPDDAYRVFACAHDRIVDHLCAGDVGMLLRDRHPMNESAAPGKFGEYALSGLPIVMTDGIGDFSSQMKDTTFACVLPDLVDMETARTMVERFCARVATLEEHAAMSRWAAERFATEQWMPRLAQLYREV